MTTLARNLLNPPINRMVPQIDSEQPARQVSFDLHEVPRHIVIFMWASSVKALMARYWLKLSTRHPSSPTMMSPTRSPAFLEQFVVAVDEHALLGRGRASMWERVEGHRGRPLPASFSTSPHTRGSTRPPLADSKSPVAARRRHTGPHRLEKLLGLVKLAQPLEEKGADVQPVQQSAAGRAVGKLERFLVCRSAQ